MENKGGFPFIVPHGKDTICPFGCDNSDSTLGMRLREGWYQCKKCGRIWARIPSDEINGYYLYAEQFINACKVCGKSMIWEHENMGMMGVGNEFNYHPMNPHWHCPNCKKCFDNAGNMIYENR